jgi:hypothetical protein
MRRTNGLNGSRQKAVGSGTREGAGQGGVGMARLKHLFTNRWFLLYVILLVAAADAGWQITLAGRRESFGRLADYYTRKAQQATPSSAARYAALASKYRDAYKRPGRSAPRGYPKHDRGQKPVQWMSHS